MKPQPLLLVSTLSIALLHAPCGRAQSNVVFYGSNSNALTVAFADTNLSASVQASIVSDLRLCLQDWGKSSTLDLGAYEPGLAGYLYNPTRCPYYPEGIDFPDNLVAGADGGLVLQIPRDLSNTYTNAFAFAAANSNAVAAAYVFVAFVSSSNLVSISSNALPNFIMFKNALPDANAESNAIVNLAPQIIPDLCEQTYYTPSILGFSYSSDGPATSNLWMQVPNSSPAEGDNVDWASTSVLWHDGKWRFCKWMDWVP